MLNNSQKVRIVSSVTNEDIFRKEVLMPLFQNMNCYLNVIDTHGTDELGTDIVLIEKGKYDQYIYTSVNIKAKQINKATSGSATAAIVIQQMNMAAKAGFNCPIQKRNVRFNQIMIITTQGIAGASQDVLTKTGDDLKTPAIFLFGDRLVNEIDKHLPEFYFYTSALFSQLATAMRKKCENLNELQRISRYSGDIRAILDVFVEPRLRHRMYEDKKTYKNAGDTIYLSLPNVLEKHSRVLIVGGAGTGKTTLVREAVLKLQARNIRDERPKIPLIIRAVDLANQENREVDNALNYVVRKDTDIDDFDIAYLRSNADVYVFIDGIDEVVDFAKRTVMCTMIDNFAKQDPNIKIILTSRYTQDLHDSGAIFPDFKRWHVMPFNIVQITNFIEKWFGKSLQSSRLITSLQDHNLLARLPNTPLVLTLLAILFESEDYREIPSNLSELYQMILDLMFGKWSLNRRVDSMYDSNMKHFVATEIAIDLHNTEKISLDRMQFDNIIERCTKTLGHNIDSEILLDDFLNHSAVLSKDSESFQFTHLSFQEFLVGQHIQQSGNRLTQEKLIANYHSDWWDNVLYFYCGLRKTNPDLLPLLVKELDNLNENRRIQAILELGYIVQSSYLTDRELRMDAIRQAFAAYFRAIDPIKELIFGKETFPEHVVFLSFVLLLVERYSSRFLNASYKDLFHKLTSQAMTVEERFSTMILALILAGEGETDLLNTAYQNIKANPSQKQLTALSTMSQIILSEHNIDDGQTISALNKRDLKRIAKKLSNKKNKRPYPIRYKK